MSKSLIDLIDILDLETIEVNMFRGRSPKTRWQRVFGGQVIGQAHGGLRAAPSKAACRIRCIVISFCPATRRFRSSTRSSACATARAYSTRRVTAIQHGQRDLLDDGVVPRRGGRTCSTTRIRCRTCRRRTSSPREELSKHPIIEKMPDFIRRYYESRPADRAASGGIPALCWREDSGGAD